MTEILLNELGKPCPYCGAEVIDVPGVGVECTGGFKCTRPGLFPARVTGLTFTPPMHLRKGQALFNFLTWIAQKGHVSSRSARIVSDNLPNLDTHFIIADPFHISDAKLDALWDEFVAEMNEMAVPRVSDADAKLVKPRKAKK